MTRTRRWRAAASLVAVVASLAALVALPVNVGAASVMRIPFTGLRFACSGTDGQVSVSGDKILHIRNATNHSLWVTSSPYLNGFADNVVDANIDLATDIGEARIQESLKPTTYNGTWESVVQLRITPHGAEAEGVGHGTGELTGLTIRWAKTGNYEVAPGVNPCGDSRFGPTLAGEILVPASA